MGSVKQFVASTCWLLAAAASYGQNEGGLSAREHHADRFPAVFDANGTYVGAIQAFDANFGVNMMINGAVVFVNIQRLSENNFSVASASRFHWKAIDCTSSANCSNPLLVSCGGALCPARPSMAIRRGSVVTLYIATPSNSAAGNAFDPEWVVEAAYDLTLHHPEPLTVRY